MELGDIMKRFVSTKLGISIWTFVCLGILVIDDRLEAVDSFAVRLCLLLPLTSPKMLSAPGDSGDIRCRRDNECRRHVLKKAMDDGIVEPH